MDNDPDERHGAFSSQASQPLPFRGGERAEGVVGGGEAEEEIYFCGWNYCHDPACVGEHREAL